MDVVVFVGGFVGIGVVVTRTALGMCITVSMVGFGFTSIMAHLK